MPNEKSFQSHLSPYDLSLYSVARLAPNANPIPEAYDPTRDIRKCLYLSLFKKSLIIFIKY
nr:MAG TPA: hypothetical protein [Caudoviricetes sp.]